MQVARVPPYVRYAFSSKERRHIMERDDLDRPVVSGGQEIGLGSRILLGAEGTDCPQGRAGSKERLGDWDGQPDVSQPITNRLHYSHSDFNNTTKQRSLHQ